MWYRFDLRGNTEGVPTGIPNVLEDDLARDSMACPLLLEAAALLSCCAIFVVEKALRNLSISIVSICASIRDL